MTVLSTEEVARFRSKYGVTVINTNCNPAAAKDKSLPTNSYLVRLENEEGGWYDIVMGSRSDIFDAYYDSFGHCMKSMNWTDGTRNPKLWGEVNKPKGKKKK